MKRSMRVLAVLGGVVMAASLLSGCAIEREGGADGHGHIDRNRDGHCDLCGEIYQESVTDGTQTDNPNGGHGMGGNAQGGENDGGDTGENDNGGGGSENGNSGSHTGEEEGRAGLLAKAVHADPISYNSIKSAAFEEYLASIERFSEELASRAVRATADEGANFVLSPASVYTALATAAACANGGTREELLTALYTTEEALSANFSAYYRLIGGATEGTVMGCAQLANSIWVDNISATHVRDEGLKKLSDSFYCTSYSADFYLDNAAANKAVRDFIKEQTSGLIDQSFMLPESTVFALVNTLYIRDIWNEMGAELHETEPKLFRSADGSTKSIPRMETEYVEGRAARGEDLTFFYAETHAGYKLKVLLPDEGKRVEEIFTPENISLVNGTKDFGGADDVNKIRYLTRLLLPAFEANCDEDLEEILKGMGAHSLFGAGCDFSAILDETAAAHCSGVRHVAKLKVDLRGIEGAATTVMPAPGAAAPDEYTRIYSDLSLDRPFAFLLTDRYDNILFAGTVQTI